MTASTPGPRKSRFRLIFESYLSVLVCVLLGTFLSAPVLVFRAHSDALSVTELTYDLTKAPSDDLLLIEWGKSLPRSRSFTVERTDWKLRLRWEYRGMTPLPLVVEPDARMRLLGYEFAPRTATMGLVSLAGLLTDAVTLAAVLMGMQLAFGAFALVMRRRARLAGDPLPALFAGRPTRSAGIGVLVGVGLLGFGFLYGWAVKAWFPHAPPSPWESLSGLSGVGAIVLLAFGAIGAPVAEELFFRGHMFARFWKQGDVILGIFVSAVLFAGAHFSDPYNLPAILVFGIVLAFAYRRTGSLLTPIVAHLVNNGTALTILLLS